MVVLFPAPSQGFQFRRAVPSSTLDFELRTCYTSTRPCSHQNRLAVLHSTRSPPKSSSASSSGGGVVVEAMQPLRPESSASQKRREAVLRDAKADTDSRTVDSALEGIDAQVLELLSENYLYPSAAESTEPKKTKLSNRPHGRPEMVPGAMAWRSMKKYQTKRELINHAAENSQENVAALMRRNLESNLNVKSEEVARRQEEASQIRGLERKNLEEGLPETAAANTKENTKPKKKATRKKRVVKKNLPKQRKKKPLRDSDELYWKKDFIKTQARPGRTINPGFGPRVNSDQELRKYYATELLTPEEEYSIGEKIQLMIQCEQVHEGFCIQEMQLPTVAEWAAACGYTDEQDGKQVISDSLERQIRPAGYDTIFKKVDPNMFVGNGLARTIGVGRGRGRTKKPPAAKITKDIYKLDRATGKKIGGSKAMPVNRGTLDDFCDMMVDGREAKQLMVQSNMRLVISISRKYSKVGVSLYDLVQEGSIGLSRAAEKFDPTKGFKFSTYASW